MSIRKQFIAAREAPLRLNAETRVEKCLTDLLRDLPQKMQAEIEKAGKGQTAGWITAQVYPDYDTLTLKDAARLPAFAALHSFCAGTAVDVCVTTTETPATTERGYEAGKAFVVTIQLDKPYSSSNFKPAAKPAGKANALKP